MAVLDPMFRIAYRVAYQLMRAYWHAVHPETHGALVAIWCGGKILLVRNSYVRYFSLPGGYVRSRESGRSAAARELEEEIELVVDETELIPVLDKVWNWEGKRDHVELFQLELSVEPVVSVDNREVVAARFYEAEEALELDLFPAIREHILARLGRVGSA